METSMIALSHSLAGIVVLACLLMGSFADAQEVAMLPSPFSIEQAARLARQRRAEIVGARARASAAEQRPAQVAAPPDPMLMVSVDHLPFALHGADVSAQFQQDFPLSRVLSHRRRAAEAGAASARASTSACPSASSSPVPRASMPASQR